MKSDMNKTQHSPPRRQQGAVLAISLIILLLMTLIAITAMQTTTLEEKMAGNMRDHNLAFQAAESALQDGTAWLRGMKNKPTADSTATNGVWTLGSPGNVADASFNWAGNGTEFGSATGAGNIPGVSAEPRYVIEEQAFVPDDLNPETRAKGLGQYFYRISTIGYGGTSTAESVLQAIIVNRYN